MSDETTIPAHLRRWASAFAEDIRSGRVDFLEVLEIALMEAEVELEVCPICVTRYVRPGTRGGLNGVCQVCHLNRLAEAHRTKLAEHEAQAALWQSRQELKRGRDRLGLKPEKKSTRSDSRRSDDE